MALSPGCEKCMKTGFCKDKSGLPIFITRYSIATKIGSEGQHFEKGAAYREGWNISDSKAPKLSGKFKQDANISLGDCTMYTLRPLRGGYLYVYDEARDTWTAYFVTNNAFLEPLPKPYLDPEEKRVPPNPDRVPCQAQNFDKAAYITVPDPDNASIIWMCFSDVEWTKDVLERHKDPAYRKNHMRPFDVKTWMGSLSHEHAGKIAELAKHVADFAEGVNQGSFLFSPSTQGNYAFPLIARRAKGLYWKTPNPDRPLIAHSETGSLGKEMAEIIQFNNNAPITMSAADLIIASSERILPGKGAIVALDDPAGIAQELAELIAHRLEAFDTQPRYEQKLVASTQIRLLRKFIDDATDTVTAELIDDYADYLVTGDSQAVRSWKRANKEHEDRIAEWKEAVKKDSTTPYPYSDIAYFMPREMMESASFENMLKGEKYIGTVEEAPPEEIKKFLQARRDKEWKKYCQDHTGKARYNEDARKEFQTKFDEISEKYAKTVIEPLANAHAKWMKSEMLAQYFICNFSTKVPQQGGQYTNVLSACISDTQKLAPCAQVYRDWLNKEGDVLNERNLVLRALALNQEEISEEVLERVKKRVELQKEGQKLLEGLEAGTADDVDDGTVVKIKAFAVKWKDLFDKSAKRTIGNVSKAFAAIPSDPPPSNSPLGRLFQQLTDASLDHYQSTASQANTHFKTLVQMHGQFVDVPANVSGTQRALTGLSIRTMIASQGTGGSNSLERVRLFELFGKETGPNLVVNTNFAIPAGAVVEAFQSEKSMPRRDWKNLLNAILGRPLELKAERLSTLTFTLNMTDGAKMRTFLKTGWEAGSSEKKPTTAEQARSTLFRALGSKPAQPVYGAFITYFTVRSMIDAHKKCVKKTDWDRDYEAGSKLVGSTLAFVSSVADMSVKTLDTLERVERVSRYAQAANLSKGGRLLRLMANTRWGAPSAAAGAAWNAKGAWDEFKKEKGDRNYFLMFGYSVAGGLEFIGFLAALFKSIKIPGPIGWGLMIAGFVLTAIISAIKASNYQKYLEKCAFGTKQDSSWDANKERKMFAEAVES